MFATVQDATFLTRNCELPCAGPRLNRVENVLHTWYSADVSSLLTLSSPVVPNGYTTKCSKPHWSNPPFLFFWHSGTPMRRNNWETMREGIWANERHYAIFHKIRQISETTASNSFIPPATTMQPMKYKVWQWFDVVFACPVNVFKKMMISSDSNFYMLRVNAISAFYWIGHSFSRPRCWYDWLICNVVTCLLFADKEICTPCPKKTKQICFCQNFVKFPPILIFFGKKMGNDPSICEVHSFSTSPNLRHHTTVLNANVPNCYTTP